MMVDSMYNIGAFDNTVGGDSACVVALISKQITKSRVHVADKEKTFKDVTVGDSKGDNVKDVTQEVNDHEGILLKTFVVLKIEGGNIVVEVDEEEYQKEVEEFKYSIVGKISLRKKDVPPTTLDLKNKMVELWKIEKFKLISMGKEIYHVLSHDMNYQCSVLQIGAVITRPNIFRTTRLQTKNLQ